MECWASVLHHRLPLLPPPSLSAIPLSTHRRNSSLLVVSAKKKKNKDVVEDESSSFSKEEEVKNVGEGQDDDKEEQEEEEVKEETQDDLKKKMEDFPLEDLKLLWGGGWAPWEEVLTPEKRFALKSAGKSTLDLPRLPQEVMDILDNKEPKTELTKVPIEPTEYCDEPFVFSLVPPRDWPPPGWKVDPKELAFIRETHTMYPYPCEQSVSPEELENAKPGDDPSLCFDRWKMFLKQYHEWVDANKESLDKEADLVDPEYYPGRRRTGKNYTEGMLELPFIYPGQHYFGTVEHIDLHEGAFVKFGCVHDGWVCIRDNDWFKLRHVIQVGNRVHVEVLAKRDPYRYRFPIELRFVNPNIDRDIFWRFKYPPIIARPGDTNLEEVARETGRPFMVDLEPTFANDPDPRDVCHPSILTIWQRYAAENLVLDDEESRGKDESELADKEEVIRRKLMRQDWEEYRKQGVEEAKGSDEDSEDDEEEKKKQQPKSFVRVLEPTDGVPYKTYLMHVNESELELEAARNERRMMRKMYEEAVARGEAEESIVLPVPRREKLMAELEEMHRRRCFEEEETLLRDLACRREAGLPVEDPRYSEDPWPPNKYNPLKKIWQANYIGDPKAWKYSRLKRDKRPRQRMTIKRSQPSSTTKPTSS